MKFGENLKKLRKNKNISQEVLAEKVGVSRQSVSKWEVGEAYPEMQNILALCTLFHCKINDLVNDSMLDIDSLDEETKMSIVKLKKDKQRKIKGLSKAIYILSRISKVCMTIGATVILISMLVLPFVGSNVKVDNNIIIIFDDKFSYEMEDDKIYFKPIEGNPSMKEYTLTDYEEVTETKLVINAFKEYNKTIVIITIEFALLFLVATMYLLILIFRHLDGLFVNIYEGQTPFNLDNANHIKRIAIYMICVIVLPSISGLAVNSIVDINIGNDFGIINAIYILFLFSMAYIFEYGYEIQQDSKGKMYDDEK